MARITPWLIGLLVLLSTVGLWWWLNQKPGPDTKSAAADTVTTTSEPAAASSTRSSLHPPSSPQQMIREPSAMDVKPDTAPQDVSKARDSMRNSLTQGDSRTPELATQVERERPSAEVLADPALYEAYELQQTKQIASVYLSILHQIPVMRARIDAAKASGTKTQDEIAEAEEAMEKLEELKREMEKSHPDTIDSTFTDTQTTATPE